MTDALAPPTPTTFDALTTAITAAVYVAVAVAAFAAAPRDVRTRVFLAVALLNIGPASGAVVLWREGAHAEFTRPLVGLLAVTTLAGSLALFHFAQVFPWRRPWIAKYLRYLVAGYLVVAVAPVVVIALAPRSVDEVTVVHALAALAVVLPLVGIAGIFVPLAGLMSLYKSYLDARAAGMRQAARATFWMLVSQLAGGVLAAIVLPLLHMVSVPTAWTTAASALFFAFGILMPVAFAAAVMKFRLLELNVESRPLSSGSLH